MKKFFLKIIKIFISKSFLEFTVLGGINTFNTALFSTLFHYVLQENIAAFFGYISSLSIAFFINCKIIFKKHPSIRNYIKFLISYIPNFVIYTLVTFVTINTLHLPQFWATVLAAITGGPITYFIIRMYAFGNKTNIDDF